MCNLWVDSRVVPSTSIIQTVAWIALVCRNGGTAIALQLGTQEDGHPLIVDNVLVCGDSELPSTVEDELIIEPLPFEFVVCGIFDKVSGPHVVDSEP